MDLNNAPPVKRYKLTWLNPLKPYVLYSKFFDSEVTAIQWLNRPSNVVNVKSQSYMLLELKQLGMGGDNELAPDYTWKVLPYGDYKGYKYGMYIDHYKWEILIIFAIVGYYFYTTKN